MNEVVKVHMASWQAMVQNRNASGLSIKEWCAANNVSESQYYYRLRQLRNAALAVTSQTFTENAGGFTQLPLLSAPQLLLLVLLLGSAVRIPSSKSALMRQTISSLFLRQ